MTKQLQLGLVIGFMVFAAAGCSRTDCEAMCDSQSLCAATGTGKDMTEKELKSCVTTCNADVKDKKVMPNGETFTHNVARCIGDADGSCNEINTCVE